MAKKQLLKEFYKPEEVTPELLMGAVDEREPRRKPLLRFVEAEGHDDELISMPIIVQQRERFANIQGFSDSSILVRGMKTEEKKVAPFHVKNAYEFKATENEDVLARINDGPTGYALSQEGVAEAVDELESMRENLQFWAIAAMVNDKQFTYKDGNKLLTVNYTEEIEDLTDPSLFFDDTANVDPYFETDTMYAEYYEAVGQKPTLILVNGTTAATVKKIADVKQGLTPQQPSDPDPSGNTFFDGFVFNGALWLPIHDLYPDLDGTLKKSVADGFALVTVLEDERTNGLPMKIHRAANTLNRDSSARAYYDSFIIGQDPFAMAVRLYDNLIPGLSRKNIVRRWKIFA